MLWSERYLQGRRRATDCAISTAITRLSASPFHVQRFQSLLSLVHRQAPRLLEAPLVDGRHGGIEALLNLSRVTEAYLRPLSTWTGTSSTWQPGVASLAHHLVGVYQVAPFLATAWSATDPDADQRRCWFIAHARGASFRSLALPIAMTRRMEHLFLASADHLSIAYAMRRAELLGLGATQVLLAAVMTTPRATNLDDGAFWRTVWLFLITYGDTLQANQIGPLIDFIEAVRHNDLEVGAQRNQEAFQAPLTPFSLKGRSAQSMLRAMGSWHKSLGSGNVTTCWGRAPWEPMQVIEPSRDGLEAPARWHLSELTNSAQLRGEGAALHHCVASYADRCSRGLSSIWSLRLWRGEKVRHVLTVEVDPKRRTIIQARGRANSAPSGKAFRLVQEWAAKERLGVTI